MNKVVIKMLKKYECKSVEDYENALKEIIQEIALLGMWRSKFFEKGAFYGETALRILYNLDRFSEDMDFSLLSPDRSFNISKYEIFLQRELESYGFEVHIEKKIKKQQTWIESTFIKANTLVHLIKIKSNYKNHKSSTLKIKLEVDTNPPGKFNLQTVSHFNPIPFSVKTFDMPTLFAGKVSAALFRPYTLNTKGRDWYDFLWYISSNTKINLAHLKARLIQIEQWEKDKEFNISILKDLMEKRIENLDLDQAKKDVLPFVQDQLPVQGWTKDLFLDAVERLIPSPP